MTLLLEGAKSQNPAVRKNKKIHNFRGDLIRVLVAAVRETSFDRFLICYKDTIVRLDAHRNADGHGIVFQIEVSHAITRQRHKSRVEESNLTVNMSAIRKALGERARSPRYIQTISGKGYRFVANVQVLNGSVEEDLVIEKDSFMRFTVARESEEDYTYGGGKPVVEPVPPFANGIPGAESSRSIPSRAAGSGARKYFLLAAALAVLLPAVGYSAWWFGWRADLCSGRKQFSIR